MSVRLPSVDLSTVVVGSSGTLDWSGYGLPTADPRAKLPQLQLFNDSGCALDIRLNSSGRTFYVPPGGWHTAGITLQAVDKSLAWTVVGVIPNSPITTLTAVYWAPGEDVTGIALGNSPVGISGSVTTSSIQSLKNDGQAPGTSIIESTPSDQASSSFALDNDGSGFWQVLSAAVLRKIVNVVRGTSGGTKATVTVGDSGDATILTVYGSIQGGQPANVGAVSIGSDATLSNETNDTPGIIWDDNSTNNTQVMQDMYAEQLRWVTFYRGGDALVPMTFDVGSSTLTLSGPVSLGSTLRKSNGAYYGALLSNGGGASGQAVWVGTTDPGALAVEGDIWAAG